MIPKITRTIQFLVQLRVVHDIIKRHNIYFELKPQDCRECRDIARTFDILENVEEGSDDENELLKAIFFNKLPGKVRNRKRYISRYMGEKSFSQILREYLKDECREAA